VLLATKAVGDFFSINGIADEMIRFNGYPILEKDDHAFHLSVSSVMRRDLHTLQSSGLRVRDVESKLQETKVKGFPVVSADDRRLLLGYIGRNELRYVLDKAKRTHGTSPETPCSFYSEPTDHDREDIAQLATGPSIGVDDVESTDVIQTTASADALELWPWVNQTPLTVSPQLPLEIVMQLFKRMGPRVIIVEHHGRLVGLVTVKDVLRFVAIEQPDSPSLERRPSLEDLVGETWMSTSSRLRSVTSWWGRIFRR